MLPPPVLCIEQATLRSRDDKAECVADCSVAAVEHVGDITDTVVETVGQKVGVIEELVAAAAGDDVPPSVLVRVASGTTPHDTIFAEIKTLDAMELVRLGKSYCSCSSSLLVCNLPYVYCSL